MLTTDMSFSKTMCLVKRNKISKFCQKTGEIFIVDKNFINGFNIMNL